jgi:hypothetical protein
MLQCTINWTLKFSAVSWISVCLYVTCSNWSNSNCSQHFGTEQLRPSRTVKGNACNGQRCKNRSEISLKSTVGNFAEEEVHSSIYHFAMNDAEWTSEQKLHAILWTRVGCAEVCQVFCLGMLRKLGIEWNRRADSRMVLTERQDSSLLRGTNGTAVCGTNNVMYRWRRIVWHQQCKYRWHSILWHQQYTVLWCDNSDRGVQLLVAKGGK